ncbi:MAG: SoxR reducing system RseC family protein [Candidatus Cryptobacteroides sp.]
MAGEIAHKGRVVSVSQDSLTVEIVSSSACSSCKAASMCAMSESTTKTVDVRPVPGEKYIAGEEVEVLLSPSMGLKAALLAYFLPVVLLIAVCVPLSFAGYGALLSGGVGLAVMAIYYVVLYFFRGRFEKEYEFRVIKENKHNL